jgi:hypothetical protein
MLFVFVIGIFVIRICFVLRYSDFEFGSCFMIESMHCYPKVPPHTAQLMKQPAVLLSLCSF